MESQFVNYPVQDHPVAILQVTLVDGVQQWDLEMSSDSRTTNAIITSPEWCPIEWEVPESSDRVDDPKLEALLLTKVQLVFDFAVGPASDDISAITRQLAAVLNVANLRRAAPPNAAPIRVQAQLWANGTVTANMEYDQKSSPLGSASLEQTELYVQHTMRQELRTRIAQLRSSGPSAIGNRSR